MVTRTWIALGACALSLAALAQAQVGTVTQSQGLVTMSTGASGGTLTAGTAITDGMTIITSGTGTATLTLSGGCTLSLQPNQAVTISSAMNCNQLVASIQNLAPAPGASGVAGGGGLGTGALATAGLGFGGEYLGHHILKVGVSNH